MGFFGNCNPKITDIRSKSMLVFIERAEGKKDRYANTHVFCHNTATFFWNTIRRTIFLTIQ
jgi:hypothetical protein